MDNWKCHGKERGRLYISCGGVDCLTNQVSPFTDSVWLWGGRGSVVVPGAIQQWPRCRLSSSCWDVIGLKKWRVIHCGVLYISHPSRAPPSGVKDPGLCLLGMYLNYFCIERAHFVHLCFLLSLFFFCVFFITLWWPRHDDPYNDHCFWTFVGFYRSLWDVVILFCH